MERKKRVYLLILIAVLLLSIISGTYAYLTTVFNSNTNSITSAAGVYSLDLDITPLYNDFKTIPMDDTDVIKALNNSCKDKYDKGACSAYIINITDYEGSRELLTGTLNVKLNNMENLSYMLFEQKEEITNANECLTIDENIYCVAKEATHIIHDTDLPIGSYDISNTTSKKFLLVFWLTNLNSNQNRIDLGDYNAVITFSLGGDIIQGNIAAAINNEEILQSQSGG